MLIPISNQLLHLSSIDVDMGVVFASFFLKSTINCLVLLTLSSRLSSVHNRVLSMFGIAVVGVQCEHTAVGGSGVQH